MIKIMTFSNNKGGVGKSTTTYNLARFLSKIHGHKVLTIDMDQQMNLTSLLAKKDYEKSKSVAKIFIENPKPEDIIMDSKFDDIYLIAASKELVKIENKFDIENPDFYILKQWIIRNSERLEKNFGIDIVLIDSAPDVGNIEQNAFHAADTIIVVLQPSEMALLGLLPFAKQLGNVNSNEAVILYNMYNPNNEVCNEITKEIEGPGFPFRENLVENYIPLHSAIEKSFFKECIPVADYNENDFKDDLINPYTQYNLFIKAIKKRGIIHGK